MKPLGRHHGAPVLDPVKRSAPVRVIEQPAPLHPDVVPGRLVIPRRHLFGFLLVLLVLVVVVQAWGLFVPLGALALVLWRL